MTILQGRPKQVVFGVPIGIIMLDTQIPFPPGDVGNATTFDFPVTFKVVRGATQERFIKHGDRSLIDGFIKAAKELEEEGVRAITGDCGFMALFQREVAESVSIPVFLSPLLMVPMVHRMLNRRQKVGILTADATSLTPAHFAAVGIGPDIPIVVRGMESQPEFSAVYLRSQSHMDFERLKAELLGVAKDIAAQNPDLGALVLECSDMPPFAAEIHELTSLPVFDFITMINMVHQAVVPKRYCGHM